jgi:hypothetical protein
MGCRTALRQMSHNFSPILDHRCSTHPSLHLRPCLQLPRWPNCSSEFLLLDNHQHQYRHRSSLHRSSSHHQWRHQTRLPPHPLRLAHQPLTLRLCLLNSINQGLYHLCRNRRLCKLCLRCLWPHLLRSAVLNGCSKLSVAHMVCRQMGHLWLNLWTVKHLRP